MSGMNPLDYNSADAQSSAFDLLPNGTLVKVRLTIRPGGAGPEGWLTQSKTSEAQYLNCEAVVLDGPHAKRRIYTRVGLRGKGGQGAEDTYANRGRALIRGMLESARGVQAKDTSDRARGARTIRGYGEINGLEFVAKIGIEKDKADPRDEGRNVIAAAIGPEHAVAPDRAGAAPAGRPRGHRVVLGRAGTGRADRRQRALLGTLRGRSAMIPRPYQRAAVAAARAKAAAHGNTLVALPVGAGKTAVAGFFIQEEAEAQPDARFLVLQHTDELIEQNRATIGRVAGLPASVVKAERDDWSGQIVFGSVQTLARANRRARMGQVSHLVIDECHRVAADSYQAIIAAARATNPGVKLLGLSATPERGDRRSLRKTFSNIAFHLPISALIAQGILVPPRTLTLDLGVADALDHLGTSGADFDMDAAAKVLNRAVLNEAVVEHWREHAADRRTIVFCATVAHAEAVAAAFRDADITAATVTGEMPGKERADLLARFDRGEVQVITNCMVLTEGFDSQPVGCIAILRPMLHRGTFIQAIGRGLRKVDPERFPGVIKTDCVVLDFAGAAQRHGSIEGDGTLPEEDEEEPGEAAYKICPSCDAEVPMGTVACPFCGHVWQRAFRDKTPLKRFQLTEIDLLDRSPFRWWDMHGDGQSMVASGFEAWAGVFFDGQHWHAVGKTKLGRLRHIDVGDRTQVLAGADDFLRQAETSLASGKSRLWLSHPATARQRELLARAGDGDPTMDFGLSKYAANCRLNFLWNRAAITAAVLGQGMGRAA